MALPVIIAKNLTGSALFLTTMSVPGHEIPASGQVTLTDYIPITEIFNAQLMSHIEAGDCILNVEGIDQTQLNSLAFFKIVNMGTSPVFADALTCVLIEILISNTPLDFAAAEAGLLPGIYATPGDLPGSAPATLPALAFVETASAFPDIYWWQSGGVGWQQSTYADKYQRPPDPNGDWVLDLSNNPGGGGNNWTSYSMGTEVRILAAGNGKEINGVAFLHGSGGTGTHNWVLLKSTATGTSAPATNTYTITAASGTFTVTSPGTWTEVSLVGSEVAVATNEWYAVMMWTGSGGLSFSIAAAVKNETYAEINAGIYASGAVPAAPGSNPTPTNKSSSTLYGIASLRIK